MSIYKQVFIKKEKHHRQFQDSYEKEAHASEIYETTPF